MVSPGVPWDLAQLVSLRRRKIRMWSELELGYQVLKMKNSLPEKIVAVTGTNGKTTTTAKIAKRLTDREKKKVLMASLDVYRPAAMDQLAVLGTQVGVDTLPIVPGQKPVDIAKRAKQQARRNEQQQKRAMQQALMVDNNQQQQTSYIKMQRHYWKW